MPHRTPSSRRPLHTPRVLIAASVIAAIGASVLVASTTTNIRPEAETSAADAAMTVTNNDIAMALRMADLTPENLAAAGVGRLQFGQLADAGLAYCAQANHLAEYSRANKDLNILRANATKVPAKRQELGQGAPITIAQAQGQINDLKTSAFTFITAPLDTDTKAKLATIRSNSKHEVPAPYKLMTEMTDKKWLELRNALSAERIARKQNKPVPQSVSSVLSPANANTAVAGAKLGYETRLAGIKDEWKTRLPARPVNATDAPGGHP